jgi:hypothetical protein
MFQRYRVSQRIQVGILLAVAFSAGATAADITGYTLTVLANPGDVIDGQTIIDAGATGISLNDNNEVAFSALVSCPQGECLANFKASPRSKPSLVVAPGSLIAGQTVQAVGPAKIDNTGAIYFSCVFQGGIVGICTQSSIVVKTGDVIGGFTLQSIGNFGVSPNGKLVFVGGFGRRVFSSQFQDAAESFGLFTPSRLLMKSCEDYFLTGDCYPGGPMGDSISGQQLLGFGSDPPSVNNAGNIAFDCSFQSVQAMNICDSSHVIARPGTNIGGFTLTQVYYPVINNSGVVAFAASFNLGPSLTQGVFTASSALLKTGDTIAGRTISGLNEYPPFAINDAGALVFRTQLPGNAAFGAPLALFTSSTFLIEGGDILNGKTVRFVSFGGINNSGAVAMSAEYLPQQRDAAILALPIQAVAVAIKPGSGSPTPINSGSGGNIPVAILSAAGFDAPSAVDRTSLTFGRTGDEHSLLSCDAAATDVNGDRLPDLVCRFSNQAAAFRAGDTTGVLKGSTVIGGFIRGAAAVRVK